MAILKQTYVSGNLFVTESNSYVSASEFRGPLVGTASWASHSLDAVTASFALNISPDADLQVKSLHVSGNAQIDGDLKVLGDLTYVGVQDLRVKDHIIEVNSDESGSAIGSANGAGVIIRNTDAAGDIELIYSSSDDKLHVNKTIAGTIDSASEAVHAVSASRADSAAQADKVAFKLSFGTGISASVSPKEYDGSQAVIIDVNPGTIADTVVSQSVSASVAATAEKVQEKLTYAFTGSDGTAAAAVEYDGHEAKTIAIDLSGLETKENVSASVAHLQDEIDSMTGGAGSIATQIENALKELDADASANAAGTAVSGGVFVLSGVAFNEADGVLTSGSATSVEVEKAGEAAKAKAEAITSASTYTDTKVSESIATLSQSVATDFSASDAARENLSQSLSQSIAAAAASAGDAVVLVESSSWIAVSDKDSSNHQTVSAKTQAVSSADASTANGLALAADVKDYVDGQVGGKNVAATGDEYVALNAANNAVTASTTIKAIAEATAAKQGLVDAYDAKQYVSSSVAALSSSIASSDSTLAGRVDALETASGSAISRLDTLEAATSSYALSASVAAEQLAQDNRLTALETASGSAISRLDALETASATHVTENTFNSYTSSVSTSFSESNARIETLESSSAEIDDLYVAKAGDTMSGDLDMGTNGIVFGDMKIVWNATDGAIEFVANE